MINIMTLLMTTKDPGDECVASWYLLSVTLQWRQLTWAWQTADLNDV